MSPGFVCQLDFCIQWIDVKYEIQKMLIYRESIPLSRYELNFLENSTVFMLFLEFLCNIK